MAFQLSLEEELRGQSVPSLSQLCVTYVCLRLFQCREKEAVAKLFCKPDGRIGLPIEAVEKLLIFQCKGSIMTDNSLLWYITTANSNGINYKLLNLSGCVLVTDVSLRAIATRDHNLTSRSLLKQTPPVLTQLILANCPLVTDSGVQTILRNCLKLSTLVLTNCYQLTDLAFHQATADSVTDLESSLSELSNYERELQVLDISGCVQITDVGIEYITRVTPFLTYLNISGLKEISDEACNFMGSCNLRTLDVSECTLISDVGVTKLATTLTNLESLFIGGCYLITDTGLELVLKNCTKLTQLALKECNQLSDSSLSKVIMYSSLSYLDLSWCAITEHSMESFPSSPLVHSLKTLKLSWCSLIQDHIIQETIPVLQHLQVLDLSWRSITDATFDRIAKYCTTLTSLDISSSNDLTSASIINVSILTSLKVLHMSWCKGVDDDVLLALGTHCTLLRVLDISLCLNVADEGSYQLGMKCKSLSAFVASKCRQLTDRTITNLVTAPELFCLNLTEWSLLTDHALNLLSYLSPQVTVLILTGCKNITDEGISHIASRLVGLQLLNLCRCTHITDRSLAAIAKSCFRIQSLNIADCFKVTDDGIVLVAQCCKLLQSVTLTSLKEITDLSLSTLAIHCTCLETVDVSYCKKLTDESVQLMGNCKLLKQLSVSGCPLLTEASVLSIAASRHGVKRKLTLDVSMCNIPPATIETVMAESRYLIIKCQTSHLHQPSHLHWSTT